MYTQHKLAKGGYLRHCKPCLALRSKAYKSKDPDKWRAIKMPSYTYVIGDIHGELKLLNDLYDKIMIYDADFRAYGLKVIFLGDYVDRGPDSAGVVEFIRKVSTYPSHIALKGNHEDMMARGDDMWIPNGGGTTVDSYKGDYERMASDAEFLDSLPFIHYDDHRVYVHAAVNEDWELDNQSDKFCMWARYGKKEEIEPVHGKHVVHGHTPLNMPFLGKNRTNLDTGAVFSGVLTCGVFQDDLPGGPIEILQAFRS